MAEFNPFEKRGSVSHSPPKESDTSNDNPNNDFSTVGTQAHSTSIYYNTKRKASPIHRVDNKQIRTDIDEDQTSFSPENRDEAQSEISTLNRALNNLDLLTNIMERCARSKRTFKDSDIAGLREAADLLKADILKLNQDSVAAQARLAERAEIMDIFKTLSKSESCTPRSFSQVARSNVAKDPPQTLNQETKQKTKTILLFPKEENMTSEELKANVLRKVDPRKDKIKVCKMSKIRNGGIALELCNEGQVELVKEKIKEFANAQEPKRRQPKLIIYNVPKDYPENEVITDLINQNLEVELDIEESKGNIKPCFKTGPKDQETYNLVIELPGKIHRILKAQGRIYLGWNSTRVADYVPVSRCFRCQKYGHIARDCQAQTEICGHCAKTGHDRKNCPLTRLDPVCYNCPAGKNHHSVHAKHCPAYIKEKEKIKDNTNYE